MSFHIRRIGGIVVRVSSHITAKPKEHKKGNYVDATAIDRRNRLLPGGQSVKNLSLRTNLAMSQLAGREGIDLVSMSQEVSRGRSSCEKTSQDQ